MSIIQTIRKSADQLEKWEISPDQFINQCRYALNGLLAVEKEQSIEADAIFDPVCRKCGDPLTTEELICDACGKRTA